MAAPTEHHCGFTPQPSITLLSTATGPTTSTSTTSASYSSRTISTIGLTTSASELHSSGTTSSSFGSTTSVSAPYSSGLSHSSQNPSSASFLSAGSGPTISGTFLNSATLISTASSRASDSQLSKMNDTQLTKMSDTQLSQLSKTSDTQLTNASDTRLSQTHDSAIGARMVGTARPHHLRKGKRVLVMRHAERMDAVFADWLSKAFKSGDYRPYDLNQPLALPARPSADYAQDAPLTEMGNMTAQMVGRGLHVNRVCPVLIVSSPALSCVQTAVGLLKTLKQSDQPARICIEPGLFDLADWYETPKFFSPQQLLELGYPVDISYKPLLTVDVLCGMHETPALFKRRMQEVIRWLVAQAQETMLVVGHAPTVDLTTRSLLGIDQETPTRAQLDESALHYPFCAMVAVEQTTDGSWRVLHNAAPPLTCVDFSSRIDHRHFFRNELVA